MNFHIKDEEEEEEEEEEEDEDVEEEAIEKGEYDKKLHFFTPTFLPTPSP